jgi:UPF0755 protein
MNDFLPPKRPLSDVQRPRQPSTSLPSPIQPVSKVEPELPKPEEMKLTPHLLEMPKKNRLKRFIWWSIGLFFLAVVIATAGLYLWYMTALQPVDTSKADKIRVQIVQGSSPADIGNLLEEKNIIRSKMAFDIYTRLTGTRAQLQAGTYSLMSSESTQEVVQHLVSGNTDEFSITFLPGATLAENRAVLIKAGYSAEEVDRALEKTYDHPLFVGKPASSDLEGYIYGETYSVAGNSTVEQILTRTFDEFYKAIEKNNLLAGFETQELTLYEAITLASIIQREVPHASDQKQVAQVFLSRLEVGMELGSDVTYQYAAKKLGVSPSPSLDSPYNTRRYAGLPPGPIASPGETSLEAVAAPAEGDYVYFLSGDDDITYFGRTLEQHEANIRDHCKAKCLIP